MACIMRGQQLQQQQCQAGYGRHAQAALGTVNATLVAAHNQDMCQCYVHCTACRSCSCFKVYVSVVLCCSSLMSRAATLAGMPAPSDTTPQPLDHVLGKRRTYAQHFGAWVTQLDGHYVHRELLVVDSDCIGESGTAAGGAHVVVLQQSIWLWCTYHTP